MELWRAYQKYKSFGGIKLLREYYRMGAISIRDYGSWIRDCVFRGGSLKRVYAVVTERVAARLKEEIWNGCYTEGVKSQTEIHSHSTNSGQASSGTDFIKTKTGKNPSTDADSASLLSADCPSTSVSKLSASDSQPSDSIVADTASVDGKKQEKQVLGENIGQPGLKEDKKNRKVWFCWLQGLDKAPKMVRVCYDSVCRYLPEREVVVIDERNYVDWVVVPEFIERKYRKGMMPAALFSDILRLELLIKYGGTWIDSTVLVTDPESLTKHEWLDEVMDAEMFMFQYRTREKRFAGTGNWFITARPGHWVLRTVRDTLYEYWRRYDCVVDYYIFHRVMGWIVEERPEVIWLMPRRWAVPSLYLRDRLAVDYDEAFWQELTSHVCLHKLNYRKEKEAKANDRSFWNKILNMRITK